MTNPESAAAPRVRIRRRIEATPPEVFEAWTDAEGMRQWMRPGDMADAECDLDVREGGEFRIMMITPDGQRLEHRGEYRVVDPPRRLVFTWISPGTQQRETLVTVELSDHDGGTELVLTHERLPDETAAERHEGGWGSIVQKLAEALEAGATADRGAGADGAGARDGSDTGGDAGR